MRLARSNSGHLRKDLRVIALFVLVGSMSLLAYSPMRTAKGQLEFTNIGASGKVSVDSNRIVWQITPYGEANVYLYDESSSTYTNFLAPHLVISDPLISGDKIVLAAQTGYANGNWNWAIFYCVFPFVPPIQSGGTCGPWTLITYLEPNVDPRFSTPGVTFRGDLVAWVRTDGFGYYKFSTGRVTNVQLANPPPVVAEPCPNPCINQPLSNSVKTGIATNGTIIAFRAKPSSTSPSYTVMYYDTALRHPKVIDTGLPIVDTAEGGYISLTQNIIVFTDNSSGDPLRVRYFDLNKNLASPAGQGPIGYVVSGQSSWDDIIVYVEEEADLGVDCNSNGTVSATEYCLRYWNIKYGSLLSPSFSPEAAYWTMTGAFREIPLAIWKDLVPAAKSLPNSYASIRIYYVSVPMKGDANFDGNVNIQDLALVGSSFGLKSTDANWRPQADLNKDGRVDIVDLSMVGSCFGENIVGPSC